MTRDEALDLLTSNHPYATSWFVTVSAVGCKVGITLKEHRHLAKAEFASSGNTIREAMMAFERRMTEIDRQMASAA